MATCFYPFAGAVRRLGLSWSLARAGVSSSGSTGRQTHARGKAARADGGGASAASAVS